MAFWTIISLWNGQRPSLLCQLSFTVMWDSPRLYFTCQCMRGNCCNEHNLFSFLCWQPEPIYNAIPLDFPDAQPRRENLRRALDDYVAEYSVCKCQPCQNGGTVIQIDGECKCMCPTGTEGVACQIIEKELVKGVFLCEQACKTSIAFICVGLSWAFPLSVQSLLAKSFEQLGNWGCWSSWSLCSGGRRRRTRTCNTRGVPGEICRGDTTREDYC